MRFLKYEFKEQRLKGKHIFKIIDEPLRRPFVSDVFRQKIIDNKLTGFVFELAWDNEV